MSIANPYAVPFSFMESFGYIPPSSRYAKIKAGDTTNWDGDSWTEDFLEWLQINGQKFNALMSCPVTDMPDVINAWYYSDDLWTIWYQDYKMQLAEQAPECYKVTARQLEWLDNYYKNMDSKTEVNPLDENSMITSAGVTRALWENMLNTEQETKVENKKIFTIGKDLLNLTNGILMLQKQGIVDAYNRIIDNMPYAYYNQFQVLMSHSLNRFCIAQGTNINSWFRNWGLNGKYSNITEIVPNNIDAFRLIKAIPPYKVAGAPFSDPIVLDDFWLNISEKLSLLSEAYYIHIFSFKIQPTKTSLNTVYLSIIIDNSEEYINASSGISSLNGNINDDESTNLTGSVNNSYGVKVFYIGTANIKTENGKVILSFNNDGAFSEDGLDTGYYQLGVALPKNCYSWGENIDTNKVYQEDIGAESITMETYDNYPDIAIENRETLDIDDVTYYKDITAEELQREQREERKILVTDIPDQGVEEWSQDVPIDDTQVQEETGTQTVEKEEENDAILDAINDLANTLDDVIDKPIESTNEPPIISDIPSIEIPSGDTSVKGLFTIWNPNPSQVAGVASYLWSSIFNGDVIDQFKKWFSNPMDAIISLAFYPVVPSSARTGTIKLGAFSTGVSNVKVVDSIFQELDCGTVMLKRKFNNFLDYSPFTKVSIYLPFIGVVPLNTDDVMNAKIHVVYRYEFLTGSCIAKIMISKGTMKDSLLYQYSGNIAMQIPLSGANYSSVYSGIISGLATGISAYASGGVSVAGAVASGSGVALNQSKESLQRSGSLGGNSGMLGQMKPYLIIERPIVDSPSTYNELLGRESNAATTIDKLSGYTEVQNVDVNNIPCTSEEKKMIYDLLMGGFYA